MRSADLYGMAMFLKQQVQKIIKRKTCLQAGSQQASRAMGKEKNQWGLCNDLNVWHLHILSAEKNSFCEAQCNKCLKKKLHIVDQTKLVCWS